MSPYTYLIFALIIMYILSYITKKITMLLLYTFIVFFGFLFVLKFSENMYNKITTNTYNNDDEY